MDENELVEDLEIRRNGGLSALVAMAAAAVAVAYLVRAGTTGSALDWALCAGMFLLGLWQVGCLVDARTPLLLADEQGVRIRLGREWRGIPWASLDQVVLEERHGPLRDGRLVLSPRNLESALDDLDGRSLRAVKAMQRLYGAPLAVPLGLTTRSNTSDLRADLRELADGRTEVVELAGAAFANLESAPARPKEEAPDEQTSDSPRLSPIGSIATIVSRWGNGREHDVDADLETVDVPVAPKPVELPPVQPVRVTRDAVRAEVVREPQPAPAPGGHVRLSTAVPMTAIDDLAADPVVDPIIGPRIAAARERLNLSIDQLSERTRIRPHVLEAIEVDDFGPCGGDFYARGHLGTVTRVLGIELAPLMAEYDARYAHAPINARRVFEAELATGMGGGIRASAGGPRWSLLLGAVMALVMVWGVARLFATPAEEFDVSAPVLSDSAGLSANQKPITSEKMTVQTIALSAEGGPSKVVVRDRNGKIVFTGVVEDGATQRIAGLAPFGVEAEHANKVHVSIKGQELGLVGAGDGPVTRNFG